MAWKSYHASIFALMTLSFQSVSLFAPTFIIFILITSFVVRAPFEAIKNIRNVSMKELFTFFDVQSTLRNHQKKLRVENLSENHHYRHRIRKCTHEALTVLLPQEQTRSLDSQKSWSMRTSRRSVIAFTQCQSRTFLFSHEGEKKINKTDYICSRKRSWRKSVHFAPVNGHREILFWREINLLSMRRSKLARAEG